MRVVGELGAVVRGQSNDKQDVVIDELKINIRGVGDKNGDKTETEPIVTVLVDWR